MGMKVTNDEIQKVRAIVYDAYCEGDTEAEWMLVVIDAELAKAEQEPVARPDEQTRRNLVSECGLEWDDSSKTSSTEPFAWATFDGEGSYDLRLYECNENYRDEYLKLNGDKYAAWVIPLYTHPISKPAAPEPQREYGLPMVIGELTKLAEGHSHCFEVPDTLPEGKYEIVLRAALKERGE